MKSLAAIAIIGGLAAAGCDCVPCPDGYACILGRCQQTGSVGAAADLLPPAEEDMRSSSGSPEMSQPPAADMMMSLPPPDLAPACVPTGGSCYYHKDAVCCSHYCVFSTNKCR